MALTLVMLNTEQKRMIVRIHCTFTRLSELTMHINWPEEGKKERASRVFLLTLFRDRFWLCLAVKKISKNVQLSCTMRRARRREEKENGFSRLINTFAIFQASERSISHASTAVSTAQSSFLSSSRNYYHHHFFSRMSKQFFLSLASPRLAPFFNLSNIITTAPLFN
jgi:hypothetical protein